MMNALSVLLSVVFVSDPHHIQYYPVWYYRLVNSFFSFRGSIWSLLLCERWAGGRGCERGRNLNQLSLLSLPPPGEEEEEEQCINFCSLSL